MRLDSWPTLRVSWAPWVRASCCAYGLFYTIIYTEFTPKVVVCNIGINFSSMFHLLKNRGKWESQVRPRTLLAWVASALPQAPSALPLSHNSWTTTNPHNPHNIHFCLNSFIFSVRQDGLSVLPPNDVCNFWTPPPHFYHSKLWCLIEGRQLRLLSLVPTNRPALALWQKIVASNPLHLLICVLSLSNNCYSHIASDASWKIFKFTLFFFFFIRWWEWNVGRYVCCSCRTRKCFLPGNTFSL